MAPNKDGLASANRKDHSGGLQGRRHFEDYRLEERFVELDNLKREHEKLVLIVASLIDAMKWHLHGATGTDQRSLDSARRAFHKHFLQEH